VEIPEPASYEPAWTHPPSDEAEFNIEGLDPRTRAALAAHAIPGRQSPEIPGLLGVEAVSLTKGKSQTPGLKFLYTLVSRRSVCPGEGGGSAEQKFVDKSEGWRWPQQNHFLGNWEGPARS